MDSLNFKNTLAQRVKTIFLTEKGKFFPHCPYSFFPLDVTSPVSPSQPSGDLCVNSRNQTLYPGSPLVPGWVLLSESTQIRVKTFPGPHVSWFYYSCRLLSATSDVYRPEAIELPNIIRTSSGEFPCFTLPLMSPWPLHPKEESPWKQVNHQ